MLIPHKGEESEKEYAHKYNWIALLYPQKLTRHCKFSIPQILEVYQLEAGVAH